jgi:signal transduction histidine kinase
MLSLTGQGTQHGTRQGKGKFDYPESITGAKPDRATGILSKSQLSPLAALAHDARNVLAALQLFSELVSEPDVLTPKYRHYAAEVSAISRAGSQLVEQISALAHRERTPEEIFIRNLPAGVPVRLTAAKDIDELLSGSLVTNLSVAVRQLLPLLSAVTGPGIRLELECLSCPGQVRLMPEDLTRILVNLVRNAADAMPHGGHLRITVQMAGGASFFDPVSGCPLPPPAAMICVQDDGLGMLPIILERIFESGFSTRQTDAQWSKAPHRGFGLAIVRGLVDAAGGNVRAVSRPGSGTRIEIELPLNHAADLTNVTPISCPESLLLLEGGRQ